MPDLLTPRGKLAGLDLPGLMAEHEAGDLDTDQLIELFQELIDTGLAWRLQGSYGRMAAALIRSGWCHINEPGESE